jgi:hypothetical protein
MICAVIINYHINGNFIFFHTSGPLIADLAHLKYLDELDLRDNHLEGLFSTKKMI